MAVVGERWPNTEFLSDSCSFGSVRTLWDQPFESYEEALVPVADAPVLENIRLRPSPQSRRERERERMRARENVWRQESLKA